MLRRRDDETSQKRISKIKMLSFARGNFICETRIPPNISAQNNSNELRFDRVHHSLKRMALLKSYQDRFEFVSNFEPEFKPFLIFQGFFFLIPLECYFRKLKKLFFS